MFMLKYIKSLESQNFSHSKQLNSHEHDNFNPIEFILKSDDNCYVNIAALKSLVTRWRGQAFKRKFITGYMINQKKHGLGPLMRPTGQGSIEDDPKKRFEVPIWMYQGRSHSHTITKNKL